MCVYHSAYFMHIASTSLSAGVTSARMAGQSHPACPSRVFVPFQKRPPRGVIWAGAAVLVYHAKKRHYSRMLGSDVPAEPARLEELRQVIRDYVAGRAHTGGWDYYRGRHVACPYRCTADSSNCPVDVLVQEINRPRLLGARAHSPENTE
jgi:hypothetical protein